MRRFVLLSTLILAGCATARHRGEVDIVRDVRFEGNRDSFISDQGDFILRQQMLQSQSPPGVVGPISWFGVEGASYQPRALRNDWQAIEVYFAHNGWFDARVDYFLVEEKKPDRRRKVALLDVTGFVEPGPETRWVADSPLITWDDRPQGAPTIAKLRTLTTIRPMERFQLSGVNRSEALIERDLQDRGFAWADVTATVEVRPADASARVELDVVSGPAAVYGPVRFHGLEDVPADVVREVLGIEEGAPYSVTQVEHAERNLFGLAAFSTVRVEPDRSVVGPVVPIDVDVDEAKFRQLDVGFRIGLDGGSLNPSISSAYSHRNLNHRLNRLELTGHVGAALLIDDPVRNPLVGGTAAVTWPRLFGSALGDRRFEVGLDTDLFEGVIPRGRAWIGYELGRRFGPLRASVEPRFDAVIMVPGEPAWQKQLTAATLGVNWEGGYALLGLRTALTLDGRTEVGGVRRGHWAELSWRPAVSTAGGGFHDVGLDVRGYIAPQHEGVEWPIGFSLRGQARGLLGADADTLPWGERLFLGGSTTLRGFRVGAVGPYDCVCIPRNDNPDVAGREISIDRRYLPHGGTAMALGQAEIEWRRLFVPRLAAVAFFDVGSLGPSVGDVLGIEHLRGDAGIGVRYDTPIGPLRIDTAIRPIYPEDEGPGFGPVDEFHGVMSGCDAVGPRRRAFDLISEFGRKSELSRTVPAVNLWISVGEAF